MFASPSDSKEESKFEVDTNNTEDDYFEIVLKTPGLQHIAESILSFLNDDVKSMAKCREVSSDFKNLIDHQKSFFIKRIQKMNEAKIYPSKEILTYGVIDGEFKKIDFWRFVDLFPKWKVLLGDSIVR